MEDNQKKITLHCPAIYEITVPGALDQTWLDDNELTITVRVENDQPITTLTGFFDQAALHGLLRRLYFLGLPVISVICMGFV